VNPEPQQQRRQQKVVHMCVLELRGTFLGSQGARDGYLDF
jgi:hypothetical protein